MQGRGCCRGRNTVSPGCTAGMTCSDTENLSTSFLAKQEAGEPGVSRHTWSAAWREARGDQMAAPALQPPPGWDQPRDTAPPADGGGAERYRLRSPSPSHSRSDPNPSLRALVQEPESWSQILPHPWAAFKLSLSAHDCECQAWVALARTGKA